MDQGRANKWRRLLLPAMPELWSQGTIKMSHPTNTIIDEAKAEMEDEKPYLQRLAYLSEVDSIIIKSLEGTEPAASGGKAAHRGQ
jgi:hypothetical protein